MGVVQLVRAPDCGSGGRGFEPHLPPNSEDRKADALSCLVFVAGWGSGGRVKTDNGGCRICVLRDVCGVWGETFFGVVAVEIQRYRRWRAEKEKKFFAGLEKVRTFALAFER